MKKIFLQMVSMSAIALSVNAQVQMGSQVSYLTGHGNNDNHTTLIGATVYGSFAITDKMSVGSVIHAYAPKKSNYNSGGISYSATDDVTRCCWENQAAPSSHTLELTWVSAVATTTFHI
jgi:hypothetical protein